MARFEVLTPLSNGRGTKPIAVGSVVTMEPDDAAYLVANRALRPVAGGAESDGEPVGTAQRVSAASSSGLSLIAVNEAMLAELSGKTHKQLDKIIADEDVTDIPFAGSKPTVAEKASGIVAARTGELLSDSDRASLLSIAQAAGFADLAALELADDAAETEIRAALMRVSAAKAD